MSEQAGFTMIEMIVAMAIGIFVLGVTVTAFTSLLGQNRIVEQHNEAQDIARTTLDRMARQLRNLASPTQLTNVAANKPLAIERATPWDLIVRVVDDATMPNGSLNSANVMRVRYCLDGTNKDSAVLYLQTQKWTTAAAPAMPNAAACPGPGWGSQVVQAQSIANVKNAGAPRPLFTYNHAQTDKITAIHADLYVDPTPNQRPTEARVQSGVILRNQNQYPEAAFEIVQIGTSGSNKILRFDASSSVDAEGQALKYCWFVDPPTPTPDCNATPAHSSLKGQGVVLNYTMPAGVHNVVLTVDDPSGLRDEEAKSWGP